MAHPSVIVDYVQSSHSTREIGSCSVVNPRPRASDGARVALAKRLRATLSGKAKGYTPSIGDLNHLVSTKAVHASGWRLEYFMADLVEQSGHNRWV
jgi:hypothetical protein